MNGILVAFSIHPKYSNNGLSVNNNIEKLIVKRTNEHDQKERKKAKKYRKRWIQKANEIRATAIEQRVKKVKSENSENN